MSCSFLTGGGQGQQSSGGQSKWWWTKQGPKTHRKLKIKFSSGKLQADIQASTDSEGGSFVIDYGFVAKGGESDSDLGLGVSLKISRPASKVVQWVILRCMCAHRKEVTDFGSANNCFKAAGDNCSQVYRARFNVSCAQLHSYRL